MCAPRSLLTDLISVWRVHLSSRQWRKTMGFVLGNKLKVELLALNFRKPSPLQGLRTEQESGNWAVLPRDRCWGRKDAATLHSASVFSKSIPEADTSLCLMLCATPPTSAPSDVTKLAACVPWKPEAEAKLDTRYLSSQAVFPSDCQPALHPKPLYLILLNKMSFCQCCK